MDGLDRVRRCRTCGVREGVTAVRREAMTQQTVTSIKYKLTHG